MRVRDRPRKRRAPQGHRPRVVANTRGSASRAAPEDDLRRRRGAHRAAPAGCRRARGVVRRRRRPHRALRRPGARRGARRGRARRSGVRGVRAGAREAGRLRLRAGREAAGAARGARGPGAGAGAAAAARGRRASRRVLPRARAAALAHGRPVIARLRGKPVGRTADGLVLDVGGVGYLVAATPRALRLADGVDEATVLTYLHVREDTLQLYGFADADERELFVRLLSVSGIGPKVALGILSGSTPTELRRAIARDDVARFEAIPGIGRKTAQRIVLELKEKLAAGAPEPAAGAGASHDLVARDALVELGWSVVEAERALAAVDADLPAEERVRQALKKAA